MSAPSEQTGSLMLGNGQQIDLLDPDDVGLPPAAYQRAEDRGRWSGDRLFFQHPRIYAACAKLLAKGQMAYREIGDTLGMSVNSVCAVAYREQIPIETLRERMGRLGLDVAMLSMECIRDLLADPEWRKEATAKDLAIIHGISFSNAQLALGGATSRTENVPQSPPDHEAYMAFIKNVTATGPRLENPPAKDARPGQIIDAEVSALPPPAN